MQSFGDSKSMKKWKFSKNVFFLGIWYRMCVEHVQYHHRSFKSTGRINFPQFAVHTFLRINWISLYGQNPYQSISTVRRNLANFAFCCQLWKVISPSSGGVRSCRYVRWKALDLYFSEIKKYFENIFSEKSYGRLTGIEFGKIAKRRLCPPHWRG